MKKLIALFLIAAMLLGLTACGSKPEETTVPTTEVVTEATIPVTTEIIEPIEEEIVVELEEGYERVDETVYATRDVNVRSGPGTEHAKVGRIAKGDAIQRVGIGDDGWSKVIYQSQPCYISSNYLMVKEIDDSVPEESVDETVYSTRDVNVRSGPGADFEKVGRITKGTAINRIGIREDGWSKVLYEGETCYISSNYLTGGTAGDDVQEEAKNETVYTTTDVNVRSGPGTKYEKVARISKGDAVTRIAVREDGWSKVTYEGQTCYISSNYLTTEKPAQ